MNLSLPSQPCPRRARRAQVMLPLSVHRARHTLLGHTLNISRSGLLFECGEPLREREFYILSVHTGHADVELAGQVIRSVENDEAAHTYALRLHGHDRAQQQIWEKLLLHIFEIQHIPGALHLSPSQDMMLTMYHSLVHREPLWIRLGRPAPLHIPFSLIIHHPSSGARFEMPVIATTNHHGCTLLTLATTASSWLPDQFMRFISSFVPVLHS